MTSELSIVDECLCQIDIYQPCATKALPPSECMVITPTSLTIPWPSAALKQSLTVCARPNIWAKADGLVRARPGKQDGSAMQRLLAQPRLLQRTSEWVEPPSKAPKAAASDADALAGSLAAVHIHSGPQPPSARKEGLVEGGAPRCGTVTARGALGPLGLAVGIPVTV